MNEPTDDSTLIAHQLQHFDATAEAYFAARMNKNHQLYKKLLWSHFLKQLPLEHGKDIRVLEAMCGYADGRDIIQSHVGGPIDYIGFDYSATVVDGLKKMSPDLNVFQQDVSTYSPPKESFDITLIIGGLHHVPHLADQIVANLVEGLKPGGIFLSFEPTHDNPLYKRIRQRIYNKNVVFDEQSERAFSLSELKSMFLDAGLKPQAILFPGLLAYILYYNPEAFPMLNLGGEWLVKSLFALDSLIMGTSTGAKLSFATLSAWQKPFIPLGKP